MTFVETLQANRGELLRLKTQLYWYKTMTWDGSPERVCLILDALDNGGEEQVDAFTEGVETVDDEVDVDDYKIVVAQLLIDGSPRRVWLSKKNIELITKE